MTTSLQYLLLATIWDMHYLHQQAFHAYEHSHKHCRVRADKIRVRVDKIKARVHKMRVRLDQIHPALDKINLTIDNDIQH